MHSRCGEYKIRVRRVAVVVFFFQAEAGIRDKLVTGVQACALPICLGRGAAGAASAPVALPVPMQTPTPAPPSVAMIRLRRSIGGPPLVAADHRREAAWRKGRSGVIFGQARRRIAAWPGRRRTRWSC